MRGAHSALLSLFILASFLSCSIDPDPGERFAIVYGVADYAEPIRPLQSSDDDALAVKDLLVSRGYPPGNVIVRTNTEATRTQLQADIDAIAARARSDSLFLFYFSGHGVQWMKSDGSTHEYIFLYDSTSPILNGGIEDSELMQYLGKVPSNRKVVLLDSCNSGGFIGDFPGVDAIPPDYQADRIDYLKAAQKAFVQYFANVDEGDIPYTEAVVIAASGASESTYEVNTSAEEGHGILTYYLLQSPRSADKNKDGWITAHEIYLYARERIEKDWNPYLIKSNDPQKQPFLPRISGGPLDLVLF
ncbi:MAG: hypothetical protein Kow009_04500 [Spirochaetales bacterium]